MKLSNLNISKLALLIICTVTAGIFISCSDDDNEGEYKLKGDISSLVPEYSYSIDSKVASGSDGTNYLYVVPKLNDNFEYWGLKLTKVDYYIDNVLTSTIKQSPFELLLTASTIGLGNHSVKATMTISGEECDDLILEKSNDFYISSINSSTKTTAEIYYDWNYVCKGETLHFTPSIIEERSPKGSKITKASYYWDNVLIETKTQSPFTWDYVVNDEPETSHNIYVKVDYITDNNTGSENFTFSGFTVQKDDESQHFWTRKLASNENTYTNGQTLEGVAKVHIGKNCKDEYSFKLYLDDEIIGESSTFPYEVAYKLKNESIGNHKLTSEWLYTKDGVSGYKTSTDETIVIMP